MNFHVVGTKGKAVKKTAEKTQDMLVAKVYQERKDSDSFFTNPKNKNLIRYILNYLSPQDKTLLKTCCRVILFSLIREVQPFNVKEIKTIKFKWYDIMKTLPQFEKFLRVMPADEDKKDKMFYSNRIIFKHWDLFVNEYFPRWIYNFFFKRAKFPAIDLTNENVPLSELNAELLYNTVPYVRHLTSFKMTGVSQYGCFSVSTMFQKGIRNMSFKALRTLCLDKLTLVDEDKKFIIGSILPECANLINLVLNQLALDDSHIIPMVKNLYKLKQLEMLSLANNNATDFNMILLFLASNPNVETICLDGYRLGEDGITLLSSALESNKNISTLSIRNVDITPSDSKTFWQSLKGNETLKTIYFDDNPLAINGLECLVNIAGTTKLLDISIKNCKLSSDQIRSRIKNLTKIHVAFV